MTAREGAMRESFGRYSIVAAASEGSQNQRSRTVMVSPGRMGMSGKT